MLEVDGLSKQYGTVTAVADVSFRVGDGETFALVGSSGSGKTTTLKMINRLIEPTAGCVRVDGEETTAIEAYELRRRIGYVFQGVGLFPHMTVARNVAVPLELLGWDPARIAARVAELLALVELAPALGRRRPAELSGGQQQRVGVARALAASPRLLLLDEPFGALDPITRDRLQQSFLALRRTLPFTAVFVTHDMAEALLVADRVGVMRDGRLVQAGTPAQLLREPADVQVAELLDAPRRQARMVNALLGDAR